MISYRYEKEQQIALYLAEALCDAEALSILRAGVVENSQQALHLAQFFWRAVDELVKCSESNTEICGETNLQEWSELLMATFRSYLRNNGYTEEWDKVSDDA